MVFEYLKSQGLMPRIDEDNDIVFKYQMLNFIFFNNDDDEQYFRLMMPAIFEVTEDNEEMILQAMNDVNGNIKVVKLYTMDIDDEEGKSSTSVWIAFEILADSTPEIGDIVPRAISLLKGARIAFLAKLEEMADQQ